MHHYQFHIGDFRSGAANLSRKARWLYRDMMDVYYDKERPLPADFDRLCDELGVEEEDERELVRRVLRLKFIESSEGFRHERCDEVLAAYHANAEVARKNGKLGGRPRKTPENQAGTQKNPGGYETATEGSSSGSMSGREDGSQGQHETRGEPAETQGVSSGYPGGTQQEPGGGPAESGSKPNHKPQTINQLSLLPPGVPPEGDGEGAGKQPKAKPTPGSAGLRFADFWSAWPKNERKQDKAKCLAKWKLKCLDLAADAILADIAVKRQTQKWKDGFVEAPLVYLNGARWEDGVQPQEAGQEAAAVSQWWETKGGVEGMAKRVGVAPWQPVDERGASVPWGRYVARVKAAVEEAGIEQ